MPARKKISIISDMHIRDERDSLYGALLELLRRQHEGSVLVLAGDVFDFFVGNKRLFLDRYKDFVAEAKSACARGARIHYIEGNHDFLIRKAFSGIPGMTIHGETARVDFEGRVFFFAHGDTVDKEDYSYRLLRAAVRSPFNRALVRILPGRWVDQIGKLSSRYSRAAKPELPAALPAGNLERLRLIYRNFAAERVAEGNDFVVMGHCHDLDEMSFRVGAREGQYINAGFPRVHGSFLSWEPGDAKIHREPLP